MRGSNALFPNDFGEDLLDVLLLLMIQGECPITMNSTQPLLSASSVAKMKLMAADRELSQALVKVCITDVFLLSYSCKAALSL